MRNYDLARRSMANGYDAMQVCLNGHQITSMANRHPEYRKDFCSDCGAATTTTCANCNAEIRGYLHGSGVISARTAPPPKYCHGCGTPHPWQAAAIENLREILEEGGLSAADVEIAEKALPDIIRDTPKTDAASMRMTNLLKKLGKPAYDITIKVLSDLASETAKKTMGLS